MDLKHSFTVPVDLDTAWAEFQDLASIAECFPGATIGSVDGDGFSGSVKVKLGPIALVYNGSGTFTEKDEAAHRFVIDAKGKDRRGNGTAGALVTLSMAEQGASTEVTVHTDLAITGKPAQFGRGVMQDVSDKLLGQFVACLEERIGHGGAAGPAQDAEVAAVSTPAPAEEAAVEAPEAATAAPAVESESESGPEPGAGPEADAEGGAAGGREGGRGAGDEALGAPVTAVAPATPPPAATPRPAPSASSRSTDSLDLGRTVLPVLAKSYWKQALGGLAVIALIIWVIRR